MSFVAETGYNISRPQHVAAHAQNFTGIFRINCGGGSEGFWPGQNNMQSASKPKQKANGKRFRARQQVACVSPRPTDSSSSKNGIFGCAVC